MNSWIDWAVDAGSDDPADLVAALEVVRLTWAAYTQPEYTTGEAGSSSTGGVDDQGRVERPALFPFAVNSRIVAPAFGEGVVYVIQEEGEIPIFRGAS